MATKMDRIVVVGASLAGLRAVEALRARGHDGPIQLVGAETHLPYDRPPLSKEILRGDWDAERIALHRSSTASADGGSSETADRTAALEKEVGVDLLLGRRAESLDPVSKRVVLDGGETLPYDGLVLATGAAVRRVPGLPDLQGIHYLRTLDDALALRADLEASPRVVVVGAGFIGAEVASSCRALGLPVTLVEALETPLGRVLGTEMGSVCERIHRDHGVDVRCGVRLQALEGKGRVERVLLSDGTALDADVVVIGVGVTPSTQWLEGSGLAVDDGVVCDQFCAASVPDVVACGDVARWFNPRYATHLRLEHWTNATQQASTAAENLLVGPAEACAYTHVPYFWSDQYKIKMQLAGRPSATDEIRIVTGSPDENRFVALHGNAGKLVAVFAMRRPRHVMEYMDLIERDASFAEALAAQV